MAEFAGEGAVYLIKPRNDKPAHFWIVLNEPDQHGRFLAVSWTDAKNYAENGDVWPIKTAITDSLRLRKESVLHVRYSQVRTQEWLDRFNAEYFGTCTQEVLRRAKCNLCWLEEQLVPPALGYFLGIKHEWCHDCDDLL
jgi:hypothetical protein